MFFCQAVCLIEGTELPFGSHLNRIVDIFAVFGQSFNSLILFDWKLIGCMGVL
jgi:hypothetical protein